jgi:protein Tob/BTG
VVFLTQLIRKNQSLAQEQVDQFQNHLSACLLARFKDHWYCTRPSKGQGYRCIRINDTEPIDPVLENAAKNSGLKYYDLGLPNELTLWVDPAEVTCRYGQLIVTQT